MKDIFSVNEKGIDLHSLSCSDPVCLRGELKNVKDGNGRKETSAELGCRAKPVHDNPVQY